MPLTSGNPFLVLKWLIDLWVRFGKGDLENRIVWTEIGKGKAGRTSCCQFFGENPIPLVREDFPPGCVDYLGNDDKTRCVIVLIPGS